MLTKQRQFESSRRLNDRFGIYRCPADRSPLRLECNSLVCVSCGMSYALRDECPYFSPNEYYWGEVSQEDMRRVLGVLDDRGIDTAIDSCLKPLFPAYAQSLREPSRIDWRFLAGIDETQTVLDIGSGWGKLAFPLARFASRVYSLEYVQERVEFQNRCRMILGLSNLHVLQGSFLALPFDENSFDVVILNGVLEWVGLNGRQSPRKMQRDVLSQIASLLKPRGRLYIGIENRWGYNSFLGAKDHSGLPFTNLLPRWLADLIVGVQARFRSSYRNSLRVTRYRTYTYGRSQLRRLIAEAGFGDVEVYASLPSYSQPANLLPLDPTNVRPLQERFFDHWLLGQNSRRAAVARWGARLLIRSNLMRDLAPHFSVVAHKNPRADAESIPARTFRRICNIPSNASVTVGQLSGNRLATGSIILVCYVDGEAAPKCVAKVARHPDHEEGLRREWETVNWLARKKWSFLVKPLAETTMGGQNAFIYAGVDGIPLHHYLGKLRPRAMARDFDPIGERIFDVFASLAEGPTVTLGDVAAPILEASDQLLKRHQIHNGPLRVFWDRAKQESASYDATELPGGIVHLDCSPYNILTDGRDRVWLVDWEYARRAQCTSLWNPLHFWLSMAALDASGPFGLGSIEALRRRPGPRAVLAEHLLLSYLDHQSFRLDDTILGLLYRLLLLEKTRQYCLRYDFESLDDCYYARVIQKDNEGSK